MVDVIESCAIEFFKSIDRKSKGKFCDVSWQNPQ